MIQIRKPDDTILTVLRSARKSASEQYRLLTFCMNVATDEGLLLYNVLTDEVLLMEKEEQDNLVSNEELRLKWFVVPQELDDWKLARQVRKMMKMLLPQCPIIRSYTILPTTDCNARCFYCFEKGRSRIPMTKDTAEKISDWIADNYKALIEWTAGHACEDQQPKIKLRWFGGEPLYNIPVIDIITSRLRDTGIGFDSSMVSNSYLFDNALVEKAMKEWNLKSIQVTLDGTEEVYNRCKSFVHTEGSAYQRVMRNIGLLLDAGIGVTVRLNIDLHNSDNLMELADVLYERFGKYKNLSVYSNPLFEFSGRDPRPRSEERRAEVYRRYQALQDKLESLGLLNRHVMSLGYSAQRCMADSTSSVMVLPTGDLGRCEHYTDSDFYAHLNNPQDKDMSVYLSFEERCEDLPICHDCVYYPQCLKLKKCTDGNTCYPEMKTDMVKCLRRSVLAKYENWKKNQTGVSELPEESDNINC